MLKTLPPQPHPEHFKRQAKDLLHAHQQRQNEACSRIRQAHPHWSGVDDERILASLFGLQDAQLVIAREFGFPSWPKLVSAIQFERRAARWSDRDYLVKQQYRDASQLSARLALHDHFSRNKYGFHRWAFDQFTLMPQMKVLEVGCGPGWLWLRNAERLPPNLTLTISDLSPGMVENAKGNLAELPQPIRYEVFDAQEIPLADGYFDVVIANHMLFHVPDRPKALAEFVRVLKPGGHFFASTLGNKTGGRGIRDWMAKADPNLDRDPFAHRFNLESGLGELQEFFATVEVLRYDDGLEVTAAGPLIDFARSSEVLNEQKLARFAQIIEAEIARAGVVHVAKDPGLFKART